MDEAACRARVTAARVGRLATVRPDGRPHVVPCTFAVVGDALWTAVDAKPKATTALQRLTNVRATPFASLLVDAYAEDWSELWWVRVDGPATVVDPGADWQRAIEALRAKYPQYADSPPSGPAIAIRAASWRGWTATQE